MLRIVISIAALFNSPLVFGAPITALAYSPDASQLVCSGDRRILICSPDDVAQRSSVACNLARIASLNFSPDGRLLAVGGGVPGVSGAVLLIDWQTKNVVAQSTNYGDLVTSVAFSSQGEKLALASADHTSGVYRVENGGLSLVKALELVGHSGPVQAVAFSPSGETIITGSVDRSLKVWLVADGKLLRSFGHHTEVVHAVAFRPAGTSESNVLAQCASVSEDRTIRVWQPEIGRMVRIVRGHEGAVFALAYSPDGSMLFSAGAEGIIRRIDPDSDQTLRQWKAHDDWIYSLAVSPDGLKLASGDWGGQVKVWKVADGR